MPAHAQLQAAPRVLFMSRRGKVGRHREKNGRLQRPSKTEQEIEMQSIAAAQPHRRHLESNDFNPRHAKTDRRCDQRAGHPFDAMLLTGVLTELQHMAGMRYAGVAARYRAVIMAPHPPGSWLGKLDRVDGRRGWDEDLTTEDAEAEARHRKRVYDDAYEALERVGHRSARAIADVVIRGLPCPPGWLDLLKAGLDCLARHFRLGQPQVGEQRIRSWVAPPTAPSTEGGT